MVLVQRTILHGNIIAASLPLEVAHFVGRAVPHAVLVVAVHHAGELHHRARLHHHQAGLRVDDEKGGSGGEEGQG